MSMEARTISPNKMTRTEEVLSLCDEWKENKHYAHNSCEIIDFLVERCRRWMIDALSFQESTKGLRARLDIAEEVLRVISQDDRCANHHDAIAKDALERMKP